MTLEGERGKGHAILVIAASFTLMIMPFFYITFNEFLTEVIKSLGLWWLIETYIAPLVARLTASMLTLFGLNAALSSPIVLLNTPDGAVALYVAWNCIVGRAS